MGSWKLIWPDPDKYLIFNILDIKKQQLTQDLTGHINEQAAGRHKESFQTWQDLHQQEACNHTS